LLFAAFEDLPESNELLLRVRDSADRADRAERADLLALLIGGKGELRPVAGAELKNSGKIKSGFCA
jgi:hypothetical protein